MATGSHSEHARRSTCADLAVMLQDARARTLQLAQAYASHLGEALVVPMRPTLNPPLWELGHIAWFADHWLCPQAARGFGSTSAYDARYDSSHVPHNTRWRLPLPNLNDTLAVLAESLDQISAQLANLTTDPDACNSDQSLYFYRLALFHEDMHAEAAIYSARALGIPLPNALLHAVVRPYALESRILPVASTVWELGSSENGFVFDNELGRHPVHLAAYDIDAVVVTWAQYLPFLEATGRPLPAHVGLGHEPAVHISFWDAKAWCDWAGRRLPTEAEWECAACTQTDFVWGDVWEWTASVFAPYPGFQAHAYKEYSQPWFGGTHQVLRGAASGLGATSPRMKHPQYRNFFTPDRTDIFAGFRSCSL